MLNSIVKRPYGRRASVVNLHSHPLSWTIFLKPNDWAQAHRRSISLKEVTCEVSRCCRFRVVAGCIMFKLQLPAVPSCRSSILLYQWSENGVLLPREPRNWLAGSSWSPWLFVHALLCTYLGDPYHRLQSKAWNQVDRPLSAEVSMSTNHFVTSLLQDIPCNLRFEDALVDWPYYQNFCLTLYNKGKNSERSQRGAAIKLRNYPETYIFSHCLPWLWSDRIRSVPLNSLSWLRWARPERPQTIRGRQESYRTPNRLRKL